jgi:hypothetical protein
MELHLIYPAGSYVAGGTPTEIPLKCTTEGGVLNKNLSSVLLRIATDPAFTVVEIERPEEGDEWHTTMIPATKLHSPCDFSVQYVTEYIADLRAAQNCCTGGGVEALGVWVDADNTPIADRDDAHILYE